MEAKVIVVSRNIFTVKVKFNLRNTKPANIPTPVRCIVRYNNERIVLPSYFYVEPRLWNSKQQSVRNNQKNEESKGTTDKIKSIKETITKLFDDYVGKHRRFPAVDTFKARIIEAIGKDSSNGEEADKDLIAFLETFIKQAELKKTLTVKGLPYAENTIKIYRTLKTNLEALKLNADFKETDLTLNTLGLQFFEDYKDYMSTVKNYAKNTSAKHIRVLKVLLADAREQGLLKAEFKGKRYQAPTEETESIYLTEKEIESIINLDLSDQGSLDRIRDLFLIGCWTGLRFSDFHNISPKSIVGDDIEIKTQKTGVRVVVPIHGHLRVLMNKYKGKTENSLPPAISNQKLNEGIKKVGDQAGIHEIIQVRITKGGVEQIKNVPKFSLITTHTARRSFSSNMYLAKASPISIMAITGHKTESSFMKYIRVTPKEHSEKIREIWQSKVNLKVV